METDARTAWVVAHEHRHTTTEARLERVEEQVEDLEELDAGTRLALLETRVRWLLRGILTAAGATSGAAVRFFLLRLDALLDAVNRTPAP